MSNTGKVDCTLFLVFYYDSSSFILITRFKMDHWTDTLTSHPTHNVHKLLRRPPSLKGKTVPYVAVRPQTSSSPYKKAGILAAGGSQGTPVATKNRAANQGPSTAEENARLHVSLFPTPLLICVQLRWKLGFTSLGDVRG